MMKDDLELLLPCVLTWVHKAMDMFALPFLRVFIELSMQYGILKCFFRTKTPDVLLEIKL